MYVHVYSREDRLWTVGHYDPAGKWHPESDHSDEASAARRIHYLNGGSGQVATPGASAFPSFAEINGKEIVGSDGMTMREYYAGQALQGILASGRGGSDDYEEIVKQAFAYADAMLAAAKK